MRVCVISIMLCCMIPLVVPSASHTPTRGQQWPADRNAALFAYTAPVRALQLYSSHRQGQHGSRSRYK